MDVGDGIVLGLEELGYAVGGGGSVVAAYGNEEFHVVLGEEREVEIVLEIAVRRFETAHLKHGAATVEDVVGQEEIDVHGTRILCEQSGITAVETYHTVAVAQESLGHAAHNGVHSRGGTAARKYCY